MGEGRDSEEHVEIEGLRRPPDRAGVEDSQSSNSINAKVAGVHIGLCEDQRVMGDTNVGNSWEPLAVLHNSLARKKQKSCPSSIWCS